MESLLSAAPWGAGAARARYVCEARVDPLTHTPAGPPCSRASEAVTGAATPRCRRADQHGKKLGENKFF